MHTGADIASGLMKPKEAMDNLLSTRTTEMLLSQTLQDRMME